MNKKLSIVIPCYNEINNIERLVAKVRKSPIENKEIIIVDDMSVDGTRDVLENCIKDKVDKIIYHEKNAGKGAALKTGFLEASGDVIIIQDADLEYDPSEYPAIIKPIIDNEAMVVYGSRFLESKAKGYLINRIANKVIIKISNVFTKQNLTLTCSEVLDKFLNDERYYLKVETSRFPFLMRISSISSFSHNGLRSKIL